MRKPSKDAPLAEQQAYWYWKAEQSGFVDIEGGVDASVAYRFGPNVPQYQADRAFNKFQYDHRSPGPTYTNPTHSFAESAEQYYDDARTLATNWPYRSWCRNATRRSERRIWEMHSEGMSSNKIYKQLKLEKMLVKGIIGSVRSVRRVVERYRAILALIDYDRLQTAWTPGNATEQILKCDPELRSAINKILNRRYL